MRQKTVITKLLQSMTEVYYKVAKLSQLISDKRNLSKSVTMNWIRTKVSFALLKSSLLCLRGPRTVCRKVSELECDTDVSIKHAEIWII